MACASVATSVSAALAPASAQVREAKKSALSRQGLALAAPAASRGAAKLVANRSRVVMR